VPRQLRGLGCGGRSGGRGAAFQRQDHLADLGLGAFLDVNDLNHAGHTGGDFDGGFAGFHFDDGLVRFDGVADLDQDAHHIAGVHIFAQRGKFEFSCHGCLSFRSTQTTG
jgi:hypothetical protein